MRAALVVAVCVCAAVLPYTESQNINVPLDGQSDGSTGGSEAEDDTVRCETTVETSLQLFMSMDHGVNVGSFLKLGCGLFASDSMFMALHDITSVCVDPSRDVIQMAATELSMEDVSTLPVLVHTEDMLDARDVLTNTAIALIDAGLDPVLDGFDVVLDSRLFAQVLLLEDASAIQTYADRVASFLSPTGSLIIVVNDCSITGMTVEDYPWADPSVLQPLFEAAGLEVLVAEVHSPQGNVPEELREKLTVLTEGEWRYTMQLTLLARRQASPSSQSSAPLPDLPTLPPLSDVYTVPADALTSVNEKGFALLPDLLSSDEIQQWGDVIRTVRTGGLWDSLRSQASEAFTSQVDKPFIRVHNLFWASPHVTHFVTSSRLASAAAQLLGTPAVRVYQDSAFFKDPGDVDSPWHQDDVACPLDTAPGKPDIVTFWIPLVDVSRDMGSLEFADGSHVWNASVLEDVAPLLNLRYAATADRRDAWLAKRGDAGFDPDQLEAADEPEDTDGDYVRRHYPVTLGHDLPAGHATAHLGWTLHHAPPNTGNRTREAFTVSFFADGANVQSDVLRRVPHPDRNPFSCDSVSSAANNRDTDWPRRLVPVTPPAPPRVDDDDDDDDETTSSQSHWPEAVAWFQTPDMCEMVLLRGVTMDDRATWEPLVADGVLRPGQPLPAGDDPRLPLIRVEGVV